VGDEDAVSAASEDEGADAGVIGDGVDDGVHLLDHAGVHEVARRVVEGGDEDGAIAAECDVLVIGHGFRSIHRSAQRHTEE
jgi:hypothetical protein